jgi:hypothetical protein
MNNQNNQLDLQQIIIDFNITLLDLLENIAYVCPDSSIGKKITIIRGAFKIAKSKTKFIDTFVEKVLIYKNKIDSGDDTFFLKNDIGKQEEKDTIDIIVELKGVWCKITEEDKKIIKECMKTLCVMAQQYFIIVQNL